MTQASWVSSTNRRAIAENKKCLEALSRDQLLVEAVELYAKLLDVIGDKFDLTEEATESAYRLRMWRRIAFVLGSSTLALAASFLYRTVCT